MSPVIANGLGMDSVESCVYAAGPLALDRFYFVLGIPDSLKDSGVFRIIEVGWSCGVLRIDLFGHAFERCVLKLVASDPSGSVQVLVDAPDAEIHPHVKRLLENVTKRLARTQLRVLLEIVRSDPSTKVVSVAQEPVRAGENASPKPYAHEWNGPPDCLGMWGLFFDDLVYVFTPLTRVNFIAPITHIFHGNHECLCVTPKIATRTAWTFHFSQRLSRPVSDRVRSRLKMPSQAHDQPFKRLSTDLNEIDTILGADGKLRRIVEVAADGDSEKIVSFHKSCLPKVMGDDSELHLQIARQKPHVHCLSQAMGHTHGLSLYAEELQFGKEECDVLKALLLPPRCHKPEAISAEARFDLVGFPDGPDTDELVEFMERSGASLNSILLPDVDVAVCRITPKPKLQVRYPNAYFQQIYDAVFDALAPKAIAPDVPYGLGNSERWFEAVGHALELDLAALRAQMADLNHGLAKRWTLLSELSPKMRLGFVVDRRLWPRLVEPERNFGLSIPVMLREMCFGIDILAYAPQGDVSYATAALEWPNCRVREFRDQREMELLLSDAQLNAVYSDHRFERRLGRNGKAQFGIAEFEMGPKGALRSFERLIRLCQLPFYERYARYMFGASQ